MSNTAYRARMAAHQLTHEHLTTTTVGLAWAPPLLDQLEAAVTPGSTGPASSDAGAPAPINLGAVALYQEINGTTRQAADEMTDRALRGTLPEVIAQAAAAAPEWSDEWAAWWAGVLEKWCTDIRQLLEPPAPRRRLTGTACPACGSATVDTWDPTLEEYSRAPALSLAYRDAAGTMLPPAEWDAACAACDATWHGGEEMTFFTRAVAPTEGDRQ